MSKTVDSAQGKWREILLSYGVPDAILHKRHQSCPFCPDRGTDRFRWIDLHSTGRYICSQCGHGSGFDFLIKFTGKDFKTLANEIDAMVGNLKPVPPQPKRNHAGRIHAIRKRAVSVQSVPDVVAYLKNHNLKPSKHLRALRSCKYYADGQVIAEYAAMITPMVQNGKLISWHITYIKDGQKAPVSSPRKMLSPIETIKGGALRLTDVYPHLAVAEGVETALAVMQKYKIPCWGTYSAGNMELFNPPQGVEEISIFGDNDTLKKDKETGEMTQGSFAGQRAAYVLANRLTRTHKVNVLIYHEAGGDFADA